MNILARPPERRSFTFADMERMVEAGILAHDERLELIDGEIVAMAAKGNRHEAIKVALTFFWGHTCPPDFMFAQETGLRLDPRNYLEPDFIVFSRAKRLADVEGPDVLLAVEVADSSIDYDLRRKPLVYASFGVRELWVIDAARRRVHCFHAAGREGYGDVAECGSKDCIVPHHAPAGFAFVLDDLADV